MSNCVRKSHYYKLKNDLWNVTRIYIYVINECGAVGQVGFSTNCGTFIKLKRLFVCTKL